MVELQIGRFQYMELRIKLCSKKEIHTLPKPWYGLSGKAIHGVNKADCTIEFRKERYSNLD